MVVALIIGRVVIKLILHGIILAAVGLGQTAIHLARRGARQHSMDFVRGATYLATFADWVLRKFG